MSSDDSLIKHIQSETEAHRWQMPTINVFFNIPHQPKYYHGTNQTGVPSNKDILTKIPMLEQCAIHAVSARRMLLHTPNLEEFIRCRRYLTAHNFDFYTTTPKQRKHRILVLHDLPAGTTVQQVLDALSEHPLLLAPNSNIRLQRVVRYHPDRSMSRRELRRPLFLVVLQANSAFHDLMRVDQLLDGHQCRWSVFRRSSIRWPLTPAVQCHRCQRLGHVSKNCNMRFRCVKCPEQHSLGSCKVPLTTPRNRLYCVLCRSIGHPASYAGCPQRLRLTHKRMRRVVKLAAVQRKFAALMQAADDAKDDLIDLDAEEEERAAGDEPVEIEDSGHGTADTTELSIDIEQIVNTLQKAKIRMSRASDVEK